LQATEYSFQKANTKVIAKWNMQVGLHNASRSTFAVPSTGKYYAEVKCTNNSSSNGYMGIRILS
jgi:hypothetical protein